MDTPVRARRILIVDDEADVRALLLATFEDAGYDVDLASDGVLALSRILARRPDLVVLDLVMPAMDGRELIAKLAALPAPPPIVVISGVPGSPPSLGPLQPIVRGYLSKPFPPDFLLRTCARILAAIEREPERACVDRRKAVRHRVTIEVALLSMEGVPFVRGHVLDLSVEGAQIDLGVPLAQDSRVRLALFLPDGREPLDLVAQVRWRDGVAMGVRFERPTPEALARIEAVLG
jgi:CheY-like chemotaxis protein